MCMCRGLKMGAGGGVDGWGEGVVLSIGACYHPPQPGRQFD